MLIFCCGAYRSGSTLQYNIVSELVERTGTGVRLPFSKPHLLNAVYAELTDVEDKHYVLKIHEPTELARELVDKGKAVCVHSYRDIRDVMASLKVKNGNCPEEIAYTKKYIKDCDTWQNQKSVYSSKYESFYDNVETELINIASFLNLGEAFKTHINNILNEVDFDENKLKNIEFDAKVSNNTFNSKNLLHHNHINKRVPAYFSDVLSEKQIVDIESVAYLWLQTNGYELYWPQTEYFLSVAQGREDYVLHTLFSGKPKNIIDVGAYDGVHLSNSYSLERKGWSSINVEANPKTFEKLSKNRPKSTNIHCACGNATDNSTITFYAEEIGVLSGVQVDEEDVKQRYAKRGIEYKGLSKIEVPFQSLNHIIEANLNNKAINVLSIDVEGSEISVLKSLDFSKYVADVIVIEANTVPEFDSINNYLKTKNYKLLGRISQNLFYVPKNKVFEFYNKNINYSHCVVATQYHDLGDVYSIQTTQHSFVFAKQSFMHRLLKKLFNGG